MPTNLFACPDIAVNTVSQDISNQLKSIMSEASSLEIDAHVAEQRVAKLSAEFARLALGIILSEMCRQHVALDMKSLGLSNDQVSLRNEPGYWRSLKTTFGVVVVFTFAYRFKSVSGFRVTRNPAIEKVLPLRKMCSSSRRTLEWSSRLASLHPFRGAQQEVAFFSGGELTLEDTTIARHASLIGCSLDRGYLYKSPKDVKRLLQERATCDGKTGRPLMYGSSDAHYIRRYVDASWDAKWKSVNGIRLWCIDRYTGEIIHLGGEFTWGDCKEVVSIFEDLIKRGILPSDGLIGGDLRFQLVMVTDGAAWLVDRLRELLPGAVWILDAYHAYEGVAEHANAVFGQGSAAAKKFYRTALAKLTGKRPINRRKRQKLRIKTKVKGASKRAKKRKSCRWRGVVAKSEEKTQPAHSADRRGSPKIERKRQRNMATATKLVEKGCGVDAFIDFVAGHDVSPEHIELHEKYVSRLDANAWRMNYLALRQRGIQIGSGAMESIHRNGSQQRLKLPGARWTERTAQALLHLRMMRIAGRWDDFWQQEGIDEVLLEAFCAAKEVRRVAA